MATARAPKVDEVFITPEEHQRLMAVQAAQTAASNEEEQTPEDRVKSMLADMRDDERAVVKIYRRGAANKIYWCDDVPVVDFEAGGFPLIRQRFGPGEYEIRVYGSQGVKTKANINIYETPQQASIIAPPQNDQLARVMEKMMEGQQRILESINNRPPENSMEKLTEMLTVMKLMREATGAGENPKSQIGEIVSAIKELKAVSAEINPPPAEDKEETLMGMAGKMLPSILGALQGQQAQPQQMLAAPTVAIPQSFAAPQIAHNPAPASIQETTQTPTENPTETPPQNEDEEMNALEQMMFNAIINKLLKMAAAKDDPEKAADYLEAKAPGEVVEFLERDDWWDLLAAVKAEVVPYKDWLFKVRESLLAEDGDEAASV